ncbi:hypothetical protein KI688_008887 [Linnemannia hyalina]|uniref:Uncharacterized protein n=1 Tax=Linnemannia hyalina TaxID=64524 RepID=A0A9P7XI13_9FUNG|nr:hypothetical protein KI688_008887 [Linnemannia hyalina]
MSQFSSSSFVDHILNDLERDAQKSSSAIADLQSPATISTMELPSPALSATTSNKGKAVDRNVDKSADNNSDKNTDKSANKNSANNATKVTDKGS